jgi:hypothetical protein
MKTLLASLSLTCALASQVTPGFSTANAFSSGSLTSSISIGGQSKVSLAPFGSNFSYDMKIDRPDGTFAWVQMSCQPSTVVGTYEARYRCTYGVKPNLSLTVVPPSSLTANFWSSPVTPTGTFSVTGGSTQPFGTVMLQAGKSSTTVTAADLTDALTPWELDNTSWPQFDRSTIQISFLPTGSFKVYSVGSDPNQKTVHGITYGVHEEALFISYHPGVGEAQVTNTVNELGFIRNNQEGVTVWSDDFVEGQMIDLLAVAPSAPAYTFPGLLAGAAVVDPSAPLVLVCGPTGGCNISTPLGYTVSYLLSGCRSQMFRANALGIGALSHIDW